MNYAPSNTVARPAAPGRQLPEEVLRLATLGLVAFTFLAAGTAWFGPEAQLRTLLPWITTAALLGTVATGWLCLARTTVPRAGGARTNVAEMRARNEAYSQAHARLVGNLAQEIESTLALVQNQSSLLLAESNDPAAVRRLAVGVADEMHRLTNLVDTFRRLARPFAQEDGARLATLPAGADTVPRKLTARDAGVQVA